MRCEKGKKDITHGPGERISVKEAIRAYTVGPALQLFIEDKIGSLKVGKFADFVILSDNRYEKAPQEIDRIKVIETYIGGRANNISTMRYDIFSGVNWFQDFLPVLVLKEIEKKFFSLSLLSEDTDCLYPCRNLTD